MFLLGNDWDLKKHKNNNTELKLGSILSQCSMLLHVQKVWMRWSLLRSSPHLHGHTECFPQATACRAKWVVHLSWPNGEVMVMFRVRVGLKPSKSDNMTEPCNQGNRTISPGDCPIHAIVVKQCGFFKSHNPCETTGFSEFDPFCL